MLFASCVDGEAVFANKLPIPLVGGLLVEELNAMPSSRLKN